jgi:transcriptional regulator with XRE-family HTH domain
MKDISEIVRTKRKLMGLTQYEFAALLGIKRSCIASYETGRSEPPGSVMLRIIELGRGRMKDAA